MTYIHKQINPGAAKKAVACDNPTSKKLSEIIRTNSCLVLPAEATIREATELMCRYNCGAVGVVDAGEQIIGIVTDRDILKKVISRNRNPRKVMVAEIMERAPETIDINSDANMALDIVANGTSRYLPVVKDNRLAAILDVRDLYEEVRRVMAQEIDQRDMLLSYVFHEPYGGYPHCRHS